MFSRIDFLIPTIYFTIVGCLGTAFFLLKRDDKEVSIKVFLIYSFVTLILFGLIGVTGLINIVKSSPFYFILQTVVFAIGIVHAFTLKYLTGKSEEGSFLDEFIFTLYTGMLGAFSFLLVFSHFNIQGYALVYTSAFLLFIVPFLIWKCFEFMIAIPEEVYPKWFFPVGQGELDIPDDVMDENSIIVVEFRMTKNTDEDAELIKSRSKLPLKLELGKFFPVFLEQYNDRNPGSLIQYMDELKQPHGWNFYIEPKQAWKFPTYLNPDLTVRENGIKENDIIVAERV